jgi:hypothetical protein
MIYKTDTAARQAIEEHLARLKIKYTTPSWSTPRANKVSIVLWLNDEDTASLPASQGGAKKYARWMDGFLKDLSLEDVLPEIQETNTFLNELPECLFVEEVEKEKKARVKKFLLETRLRLGI